MSKSNDKSIDTLVEDIYQLFQTGHVPDETLVGEFGSQLARVVRDRLVACGVDRPSTLRMSNLGRPDRQLWYEVRGGLSKEVLQPYTHLKFLIGDIFEHVLLFLSKCAGHQVTHEQGEVEVDGVIGHIDAIIDGTVVDVKSTSAFAFRKFKDGSLADDDPFGYVEQISGYATALGTDGAFLAGHKEQGHLALHRVSKEDIQAIDVHSRIEHIKEVLASDEVPERCYEPVPEGQSGNLKLDTGCSYCPFKHHCWSDCNNGVGLRTFLYSKGPVHMVHVAKEPNVPEITF